MSFVVRHKRKNSMENINPKALTGPRSYFTNFDHRIVGRSPDLDSLKIDVERNLKVLLLFKSKVVCAASHLVTPFAYSILKDCPELIRESHIIPALRSGKPNFLSIADRLHDKSPARFLDENTQSVVRWEVEDNSNWFKEKFVNEFKRSDSLIRQRLNPVTDRVLNIIIEDLQKEDGLTRNKVTSIAKLLKSEDKEVLFNYRELIYHISGARVVNCESALPQENYIDFDFEKRGERKISLSETHVAWKMFVEMALQSIQSRIIPVEILDMLSFSDILEIRRPLLDAGFQKKYDGLLSSIYDTHELIGNDRLIGSGFLSAIEGDIRKTFDQVFEKEVPKIIGKRAKANSKCLVTSTASIALGAASLVPELSLVGVIGLAKDTLSFIVNLKSTFNSIMSLNNLDNYVRNRERMAKAIIKEYKFTDEPVLLEMVDYLSNSISQKMKM